jgi:hypothetical protein
MERDKQGTFISKFKTQKSGYQPYLAYLPLVPIRGAATSEGQHCSGFPIKASLSSCRDSVDSALLWPSRLSFVLKQYSASTDYFNCSKTRRDLTSSIYSNFSEANKISSSMDTTISAEAWHSNFEPTDGILHEREYT